MLTLWYLILGWKEYNKPYQKPNQSAGILEDLIKKPDLIPQKKDEEKPTKPTDIRKPDPPKSIPIDPRPPTTSPRNIDLNNKVSDLPKAPEILKPSSPKDIPKVPDAPKPTFPSKIPEIRDTPKIPTDFSDRVSPSALKTSDSVKISEPPKVPDLSKFAPKTPESPKLPEPPKFSTKTPESPKLPEPPKFAPKTPESPKLPEPPKFAPKTPESPKLPEPPKFAPKTPESPKLPEPPKFAPKTPESPKLPEPPKFAPKTPESPKVPQFYKGPKTSEDSPRKFDLPNFPSSNTNSKNSEINFKQEPFSPLKPDTPGNSKPTSKGDELFGIGNDSKNFNSPNPPWTLKDLTYGKGELPDADEWASPKVTPPNSKTPKYMEESVISNPDSLELEEEEEEEDDDDSDNY